MGYLLSTVQSLWATLRQALHKPTTVEFPKVKRQRAPRIRASFALVREANGDEACIGCKKCEKVCPSEVITVVGTKKPSPITGKARGYAEDFTLNLQACIVCELCVQVCPTDAIIMVKEQEAPGFSRADLTLTMDKLYKNGETKERLAWSSATVLGEHQKPLEPPKPAPKPAAPAAEAPAAAPAPAAAASKPADAPKPAELAAPPAEAKPAPAADAPAPADKKGDA
ncbi:MAG: 4Fe-4S binding protein [Myxococcota bacterium]